MLIALTVVAAVVAYVFVVGIVRRVLLRTDLEATRHVEDVVSVAWPTLPLIYALLGISWVVERCTGRLVRLGERAADIPGRVLAWARVGRRPALHDDCVSFLGPCDRCAAKLRRHAEARLPRARAL